MCYSHHASCVHVYTYSPSLSGARFVYLVISKYIFVVTASFLLGIIVIDYVCEVRHVLPHQSQFSYDRWVFHSSDESMHCPYKI